MVDLTGQLCYNSIYSSKQDTIWGSGVMVATLVLGTSAARRVGSSPTFPTKIYKKE